MAEIPADPPSVADLDAEHLHRLVTSYHRLRWVIVAVLGVLIITSLAWLAVQDDTQQQAIIKLQGITASSCAFFRQVAQDPALTRGVRDTAIQSYAARGCQPALTDP